MITTHPILSAARDLGSQGFIEGAPLPPQIDKELLQRARYFGIDVDKVVAAYTEGWKDAASWRDLLQHPE